MGGPLLLLGPQRGRPRLAEALDAHALSGPVAVVSAGWRHDEAELGAMARDLGDRLRPLPLYRWFDEISLTDDVLAEAYSRRQAAIIDYKDAYRDQLDHMMAAVAAMQDRTERNPALYGPELAFTHEALRALDRRALQRVQALRASFPATAKPWEHKDVRARHEEAKAVLSGCSALLIAGGHVGVLRNRLFFFGLEVLTRAFLDDGGAVVAWSAGAMTLAERIYLFYDDPPRGEGHPEVFDTGMGIVPDLVCFPHASTRLRTSDPRRIARLASRIAPARALTLDAGAWLEHTDASGWRNKSLPGSAHHFTSDGALAPVPETPDWQSPVTAPPGEGAA